MSRPVGLSAGTLGLVLAWVGGVAILRLSGAAPVMVVLAVGVVSGIVALVAGWITVAQAAIGPVVLPATSTVADPVPIRIEVRSSRPVWLEVLLGSDVVAAGWTVGGEFVADASMPRRGVVDRLDVRLRSSGVAGLVWWGRRVTVPVADHLVAPRPAHGPVRVDGAELGANGETAGASGASAGDVDGVRAWRDGDAEHAVHWPSSLRAGELIVRDRREDVGGVRVVRALAGSPDPDAEAGRVRRALDDGLRAGDRVYAAVGDGVPEPIADLHDAMVWTASVELGRIEPVVVPWWRREIHLGARRTEPEVTASASTRWWAAAATWVSLAMLTGALGYPVAVLVSVTAGVALGAVASAGPLRTGEPPGLLMRAGVAVGAVVSLVLVVAASGRLDGLLDFMRGPLPQVLILLIVLHGFECRDRRTVRVSLAISAVVVMYAAGFRVDDRIVWWIAAWAVAAAVTSSKLSLPVGAAPASPIGWRWAGRLVTGGVVVVGTVAGLVLVPVPDGPARLTLPTLVADGLEPVGRPGGIVGPDGEVRDAPDLPETDPDRGSPGVAGGYTGFAATMDTSVRGGLGDDVVMRVRAPAPDYWRGQTFSRFDGRTWFADADAGVFREGPDIEVPGALGDIGTASWIETEEFVQTYYLETDMPNLVFHAYRPVRVILDADVWTRSDGALRAATVLPEGSIYTVVSERARVDATSLRVQGLVEERLSSLGQRILEPYLEVPATTTSETVALADRLAEGRSSTYDVVQAYVAWLGANVEYDLDAPLPDPGEDAVHDFLFDTKLGFCEQIASALTVMLRTQGVPARLVTGYLPGSRDRVAGVFEVRASDAHAWVEVWFPESGWQAFDPTASVPLSADADIDSLGGDLIEGVREFVTERGWTLLLAAVLAVAVGLGGQAAAVLRRRRRRGRWGVLQDRFGALAAGRGAPTGSSNRRRARWWPESEQEAALAVAERLDRVAFDPSFDPDDDPAYRETRELVGSLGDRRG
jgi:hypothetical protein